MTPIATRATTIALGLSLLVIAGCGAAKGESGSSRADSDEARLKFAQCMREHGVDVPDPQPGGGPITFGDRDAGPGQGGPQTAGPLSDPQGQEAMKACQKELGDAAPQPPSAAEQQEMQDAALAFAQCMRDHGVDMPDPQFKSGPGGGALIQQGGPNADPDSPTFRKAQEACQDKLPTPPGGGGPGFSTG